MLSHLRFGSLSSSLLTLHLYPMRKSHEPSDTGQDITKTYQLLLLSSTVMVTLLI